MGLFTSRYMLGGTILHHFKSYEERFPDNVEITKESLYMDDLVSGSMNNEKSKNIGNKKIKATRRSYVE